jgi:hypothetical protein
MRLMISTVMACLATACAPLSTTYQPITLTIDVRDAHTHAPIQDAVILGSTQVMFYPEMQDNMFGRPGVIPSFVAINEPSGWQIETDSSGAAKTSTAGGTPITLAVMAPGYATARGLVTIDAAGHPSGALSWARGDTLPDEQNGRTLEFRVQPAGTPAP